MAINRERAWAALILSCLLTVIVVPPRSWTIIAPAVNAHYYQIPKVRMRSVTVKSGLTLFTPEKGDQCWDTHLLCVPYPPHNLRLRVPGNIAKGFSASK